MLYRMPIVLVHMVQVMLYLPDPLQLQGAHTTESSLATTVAALGTR